MHSTEKATEIAKKIKLLILDIDGVLLMEESILMTRAKSSRNLIR